LFVNKSIFFKIDFLFLYNFVMTDVSVTYHSDFIVFWIWKLYWRQLCNKWYDLPDFYARCYFPSARTEM